MVTFLSRLFVAEVGIQFACVKWQHLKLLHSGIWWVYLSVRGKVISPTIKSNWGDEGDTLPISVSPCRPPDCFINWPFPHLVHRIDLSRMPCHLLKQKPMLHPSIKKQSKELLLGVCLLESLSWDCWLEQRHKVFLIVSYLLLLQPTCFYVLLYMNVWPRLQYITLYLQFDARRMFSHLSTWGEEFQVCLQIECFYLLFWMLSHKLFMFICCYHDRYGLMGPCSALLFLTVGHYNAVLCATPLFINTYMYHYQWRLVNRGRI